MTDYRIEAATKEEWAERALRAEAKLAMVEALMDAGFAEYERRLAKAVENTLDAASAYMTEQYGISALSHPVDRARVIATLAELKGQDDE